MQQSHPEKAELLSPSWPFEKSVELYLFWDSKNLSDLKYKHDTHKTIAIIKKVLSLGNMLGTLCVYNQNLTMVDWTKK